MDHPTTQSAARAKSGSRSVAMPNVSQRTATKVMKAARSSGLDRYVISFKDDEVRVEVGLEPSLHGTDLNDFDQEFG
ncbi:hypothetical protein [Caulobacter sp.]|uniref:hypothetical protein n=1 Tax=Caulobacter sp. TaxID=78 RepID=UPI003BB01A08